MKGDKVLGAYRQFVSALFHEGSYGEAKKIDGTRACVGYFYGDGLPEEIQPETYCALSVDIIMANPYDDSDDVYKMIVDVLDPGEFGKQLDDEMERIRDSVQFVLNQFLPQSVRHNSGDYPRRFFFNIYE